MGGRIPFDSLTLAAVAQELQPLRGARVQRVLQPSPHELVLALYRRAEHYLLLSCDPSAARVHLISRRPATSGDLPPFGAEVRKRLMDSRLVLVRQVGLDRMLELGFETALGPHVLVGEFMGKHSNLILLGPDGRQVAAAKWVGPGRSRRPVLPGKVYAPPPFEAKPPFTEARESDDLSGYDGVSPFLSRLIASGVELGEAQQAVLQGEFRPVYVDGSGAYPLSVASLGYRESPRDSISSGLEQYYASRSASEEFDRGRTALRAALTRVEKARASALAEVKQGLAKVSEAPADQLFGELILAYQGQIRTGDRVLEAFDYEGAAVRIALDPEATPVANAQRYFERARHAKRGAGHLEEQAVRLQEELESVRSFLERVDAATDLADLTELEAEVERRRWKHRQTVAASPSERPFEGKAVREALAPGGWRVLWGDNSEANDYLTSRVAKPNDWWLHVRGQASAHVVIPTANRPERVPPEVFRYAAELAVRHSVAKHSSYVPVDLTLKKYVRKPRGSSPGAAVYSHERTLHVESQR